ncbi:MAG: ATP-binding protein [Clostridiales bacterium]|nr:ATP-binding protein [Clostridiales bacterium]
MRRKIMADLLLWKQDKNRKPLVMQGARQVGKTYALLAFGREQYENVAYFNFEANLLLCETFNENIHPDYLLPLLSHLSGETIIREKTLVIFDEVQACERALTSLKYFCEEAPDVHVIAAGSLLGVAVQRKEYSFPVGKVDLMTMHPMNLEEFLWAMGEEDLVRQIRICYEKNQPMPAVLHEAAMALYRQYLVVGGMPEVVLQYANTRDFNLIRNLQHNILQAYLNDMSKYSTTAEVRKTRQTFDSLAVQLSKENTRFQYKLIKKGGRAAEFEGAIEWLVLSGIIHQVFRVEQGKKPLHNYRDIDTFKTFLADLGLLAALMDLRAEDVLFASDSINDYKGGLVENYAQTQLAAGGHHTYFWSSDRSAEVDFVIQLSGQLIPIEVKSADNTRAKSLKVYMDAYKPAYAIKLSAKNFGYENSIKTLPLYAAFCIQG